MSHPRRVITSTHVWHNAYVCLAYAKRWRCPLNKQGQIATLFPSLGCPWPVETSHAHCSIQRAWKLIGRGHDKSRRWSCLGLPRQSLLYNICFSLPMSKISFRSQASGHIRPCTVSGTNHSSSLRSTCSIRGKSEQSRSSYWRRHSLRSIPSGWPR